MKKKSELLGLAFDCKDGHTRITKGDNFYLLGGSERTHDIMQEKAIDFTDEVLKRGKTLDGLCREEFLDIADKIGLSKS